MNQRLSLTFRAILAACVLVVGAGVASAQTDVYKVNYFANNFPIQEESGVKPLVAVAPLATIRIDNPGFTYGNLCAMIYVFDNDQQLTECCGCIETHNGLRTIGLNSLTGNPLTGVVSNNGVVKIVSAAVNNSPCDPSANVRPTRDLRAWATHVQTAYSGGLSITETEFSDAPLGATELANLQAQCAFIGILGSGHGICSCGFGD